jgi:hypothetical protein
MDFAQAKARLVRQSRETFGEKVTIRPMKAGGLDVVADPNRAAMTEIVARFDYSLDPTKLGGSDKVGPMMMIAEDNPTFTIPRALLAWDPGKHDQIDRANGEIYEIVRPGLDGAGAAIFVVSRVN